VSAFSLANTQLALSRLYRASQFSICFKNVSSMDDRMVTELLFTLNPR
jgi:hypothetical protein